MGRLIVVSNRVALPSESRAGGLALALLGALKETGGVWFGWSGKRVAGESGALHEVSEGNIRYLTVDLSRADHDDYYSGFSNATLWPLLHFRLDLVDYSRQTWDGYQRVNALFAKLLMDEITPDDTVWIHDYHLIPLAKFLRERGATCRIGFYLHVPMPSSDLLAALPEHAELFAAMSCYDLVGFQTYRDLERFQDYVRLFGGGRVVSTGVLETARGERFLAAAFPISIDTAAIEEQAALAVNRPGVTRLRRSIGNRQMAIGVDRLDYSKGLPNRFEAFQRYLERHRDHGDALTFLQIAPPSRSDVTEYQALRARLEGLTGHINGAHSEPDWTPVRYVNRNFPHSVLTGFYRIADIALVTPLRDGMNLVAKEFLASQDPDDPGVLILSRFAGAAAELGGEAVLVNPYDVDGVADALATAAAMPLEERKERWDAMMRTLRRHDITYWRRSYLKALARA